MKTKLLLLTLLCTALTTRLGATAPGTLSANWTGSQTIPDNNASGVAFSFNLLAPGPLVVTNVVVDLTIAGGWNGDLYAYLSHGSGFSVLLNRVGRTSSNPDGSGVSGLNVELSDSYLTDIHTALNNPLTGNFAPDARNVNPFSALGTDPRSAYLSSFNGSDPNAGWILFFADLSPAATSTIQSWTVNVGVTVPEPGRATLLGLALAVGAVRRFGKFRR